MRRLERLEDLNETLLAAFAGWQAGIWTAIPAIVQSFDPDAVTCVLQPAIKGLQRLRNGQEVEITPPLLLDVPVVFQRGGGFTMTFPIKKGDEALVVLASRCIDNWWLLGGVQPQAERRMHDLSDSFCFVGPFSQVTKVAGISTTAVQIRNDAQSVQIELTPANINIKAADVNVTTTGNVNVTAAGNAVVTATGNATINAAVATIKAATINLQNAGATLKKLVNAAFITLFNTHVHSGVTAGGANTGVPTALAGVGQQTSVVNAE